MRNLTGQSVFLSLDARGEGGEGAQPSDAAKLLAGVLVGGLLYWAIPLEYCVPLLMVHFGVSFVAWGNGRK